MGCFLRLYISYSLFQNAVQLICPSGKSFSTITKSRTMKIESRETCFRNLTYLTKALNRLNIDYKEQEENITNSTNLVIPQSNGYDIEFVWNGDVYELVIDMSFWEQPYPVETFIDKVSKQYAGEVIIGESHKMGFQPIQYQQNIDGSNTVVLERWNQTS